MLAVAGAADTLTVTFRSAMVQTVTPDEFRGRVSSVEYIIGSGGAPVGNVESGAVAALTSPAVSTVAGGLGCLAIAALIGLMFPAFARYRSQAVGPGEPATRDTLVAVELQVTDNPDKARFEIVADGELAGFAQYYLRDGQIAFTHTETDDRFRGHGLGGHLVQAALDAARERHLAVLPYCPFVKSWIGDSPRVRGPDRLTGRPMSSAGVPRYTGMDYQLELVLIPVTDVDRAKKFYLDDMGFVLIVDTPIGRGAAGRAGRPAGLGLRDRVRHRDHLGGTRLGAGPAPGRIQHRRGAGRARRARRAHRPGAAHG